MQQPFLQRIETMPLVELRIRRLMLQDVARGPLFPQIGVFLPALVPKDQQDIHVAAEQLTDLRDRLADCLGGPRNVARLQRDRSDAGIMDMAHELDDAYRPVNVARHPVVGPHGAVAAVLHASAGDLDHPAHHGAVTEAPAADGSGALEELLLGFTPYPQQFNDLGSNHGGSLQRLGLR